MITAEQLVTEQKAFFAAGSCTMPDARLAALYCLNDTLQSTRPMVETLLRADGLGAAAPDAVHAAEERWQKELLRLLRSGWKKEQGGRPTPCGTVLLCGAHGASFAVTMAALMAAVAAGNTVVMSLEKMAPASADCIRTLVSETFEPEYIAVASDAFEELRALPFDATFDADAIPAEALSGREGLRQFSRFTPV